MHRSRARPSPLSSKPMEIVPKSLGQDFLKDCGYREGKALRLHGKPIFANFSQLKIVPILVVLRSKTQNIIPKGKSVLFGSALRRSPLLQGFPAPYFGAHCV